MRSQADLVRLVARVQAGENEAWGELFRELAPAVFRLCRRVLPNPEDAEDATTEIFLKARLKLDQYDSDRPFTPWLYKLASNHCWDELRKSRSRDTVDLDSVVVESPEPGPLERLLVSQKRREIRRALTRLGDRERLAIVMRYYAELSYQEIAEVLGVTSSFVGVMLLRARRRLRQVLADGETS
jgi:RNA polymerase sigma-70 factor (ECF subfamily)